MSPMARDSQPKPQLNIQSAGPLSRLSATVTNADDSSPPSSPLTATSSPLSEPPDETDYRDTNGSSSKPRRSMRTDSQDLTRES